MLVPGTRLLFVTQYYWPEIGAPQVRLRSVARELCRRGSRVEVLTAMPSYPAGRVFAGYERRWRISEEIDGIPVRRTWAYPRSGRSTAVRLVSHLSFAAAALAIILAGPRYDALVVESDAVTLGVIGLAAKKLRGMPYILNVPDLHIEVARELGFLRSPWLLRAARRFEDFCLKEATNVSTVTRRFIEYFQERGIPGEKVSFLPNGADASFLRPMPADREMLARWGLQSRKVILYVGTHAYYQGLETLLGAADALRHRKDIAFLFIGEGPERSPVMAKAKALRLENVVFGQSPYEEMPRLYSIAYASVAILRDFEAATAMRLSKVFPSLSCGVPVIYSGTGEGADLLVQNRCGLAVPPESPARLAEAVLELTANPNRRTEMGRRGRTLVEREYDWGFIVERWVNEVQNNSRRRAG